MGKRLIFLLQLNMLVFCVLQMEITPQSWPVSLPTGGQLQQFFIVVLLATSLEIQHLACSFMLFMVLQYLFQVSLPYTYL